MKIIFYTIVACICIAILYYFVDFHSVSKLLLKVKWEYIILSVILGTLSSILLTLRIKMLLDPVDKVPLLFLWMSGLATGLLSLISSLSIGGFLLPYLVSKKAKISYAYTFAVLLFLYLINAFQIILQSIFAVIFFAQKKIIAIKFEQIPSTYGVGLIILIGVCFAAFLLGKMLNKKIKFARIFQLRKELTCLKTQKTFWQLFSITIVITVLGLFEFYLYFVSMGVYPRIIDLLFATSIMSLLGLLPGIPLKIGQYEAFGILTLPYLLHIDKNNIFTILLLQHLVSTICMIVFGFISLYVLKIDKSFIEGTRFFKDKFIKLHKSE